MPNATAAMALLRMRNAAFSADGVQAGPFTLDVGSGERAALAFASAREAGITALLAAGIVKATSGSVLIDEYDPRVQSVHCKRIAAFVPHEPLPLSEPDFARYIAYRAALWNVEPAYAQTVASLLLRKLGDIHEAFAYPLVGALIARPRLVVLDRPPPAYASQILAAVGTRALFSTHAGVGAARAFSRSAAVISAAGAL
jgi:hypothetical protein